MGAVLQDEHGVREVGMKVRHLRKKMRGVVTKVDGRTITVACRHGLTVTADAQLFETLLEQQRRINERWRRNGGSKAMDSGEITRELWTAAEERYAIAAYHADVPLPDQAEELNRTVCAVVSYRSVRLGIHQIDKEAAA